MIHSASRASLETVNEAVDGVVSATPATRLAAVAGDLYGVAGVLTGQLQLRRVLADASTPADGRIGLLRSLVSGKVSDEALALLTTIVGSRWSSPWDMTDAVEIAGDRLLFGLAEKQRHLDTVEDQVFRLGRIIENDERLIGLLDDASVPGIQRQRLLDALIDGKVDAVTKALLDNAIVSTRKRSIVLAIDDLLEEAARRRNLSTAIVRSAVALTDAQEQRLAAVLEQMFDRPVAVRTTVDPAVEGGLVIRLGDELIDGSVASRLAAARTALVGGA